MDDDLLLVQSRPATSSYRFEEIGTQEWFCAKTNAPLLPKPLVWRVRIVRRDGYRYLAVEIVRPRPGHLRRDKIVTCQLAPIYEETDWREEIGATAIRVYDSWDLARSIELARQGENPYVGTFERGENS